MTLSQSKIFDALTEKINIFCFSSVDSTNNEAKRRAQALSYAPSLFVSASQTGGRGRHGHDFYSPEGGLYLSLLLPVSGDFQSVQGVTCRTAVCVCEAIEALTSLKTGIKWVNDIYVRGRKVSGILCELISDESYHMKAVVIGVGVNLTTSDFPYEIRDTAGSIGDIDKNLLTAEIVNRLRAAYANPDDSAVIKKYAERSIALGKRISYRKNGVLHTAKAVGIDKSGGLIVEENGEQTTLRSGEISILIHHS